MENLEQIRKLIKQLNEIGESNFENVPQIKGVDIFKDILNLDDSIKKEKYNDKDNKGILYKELLTRYLFLNSILDQGPDMEGVRILQANVTNRLYKEGIFFLHDPSLFFKRIDFVFDVVKEEHENIKKSERTKKWAENQKISIGRYNLFLENSKQLSSYILGRWAPPLSIIQIRINEKRTLLSLFEGQKSAEDLSIFIKSDEKYGMGKAIGNKAAHLLVKWLIYSYGLIKLNDSKWGQNSYELPFDSNAGRVLFMTGFFHYFFPSLNKILFDKESEKKWVGSRMNQKFSKSDNGRYHMYITNSFRGAVIEDGIDNEMKQEIKSFLKEMFGHRFRDIKIQHILNYIANEEECKIGAIDDGLMKIGTTFCLNNGKQKCDSCPLNQICSGKNNKERKTKFFT